MPSGSHFKAARAALAPFLTARSHAKAMGHRKAHRNRVRSRFRPDPTLGALFGAQIQTSERRHVRKELLAQMARHVFRTVPNKRVILTELRPRQHLQRDSASPGRVRCRFASAEPGRAELRGLPRPGPASSPSALVHSCRSPGLVCNTASTTCQGHIDSPCGLRLPTVFIRCLLPASQDRLRPTHRWLHHATLGIVRADGTSIARRSPRPGRRSDAGGSRRRWSEGSWLPNRAPSPSPKARQPRRLQLHKLATTGIRRAGPGFSHTNVRSGLRSELDGRDTGGR